MCISTNLLAIPNPSIAHLSDEDRATVKRFQQIYFDAWSAGGSWKNTSWMGVRLEKSPLELWVYHDILFEKKPEVVIESGALYGGSALFLANLMDVMGQGEVITIDTVYRETPPVHERITYLHGSSLSADILNDVSKSVGGKRTMVILDSNHRAGHVLKELKAYSDFVSKGQYLVVEDTILTGYLCGHGISGKAKGVSASDGPLGAVSQFMEQDDRFTVDRSREKYLFSFFPYGYLLRK